MLRRGIGPITGIHGTSIESVVLVDSVDVFESVKRAVDGGLQEFYGDSGFRVVTGGRKLGRLAIAFAPPYPPALYDAVQELVVYGARRIVAITRGFSLRRNIPAASLILAQAAMGSDSVSSTLLPRGMPLLASRSLYARLSEEVIRRGQGGFEGYYRGKIVLTVDNVRMLAEHRREFLDEISRYKDIIAADTVTAPLYALQYIYPSLEASTLIYVEGDLDYASKVVEEDIEHYQTTLHRINRSLSLLTLEMIDILAGPQEV